MTRAVAQDVGGLVERVFVALADGKFHSGENLATLLGVSRSAVWKATHRLRELGATVHAVHNRGYRLVSAGDPLDAELIREGVSKALRSRMGDSTPGRT